MNLRVCLSTVSKPLNLELPSFWEQVGVQSYIRLSCALSPLYVVWRLTDSFLSVRTLSSHCYCVVVPLFLMTFPVLPQPNHDIMIARLYKPEGYL